MNLPTTPIGFSTGCLHLQDTTLTDELVRTYLDMGIDGLELSVSHLDKLGIFPFLTAEPLLGLRHLSVHAPVRLDDDFLPLMTAICSFCRGKFSGTAVVLHPDMFWNSDGYDFSSLQQFHLRYALENMDARKGIATDVDQLHVAFAAFSQQLGREAGFVLDVNHSYINDSSGNLRNELIGAFGDRLVEINASSYIDFHEPFVRGGKLELLDLLPHVPVILESGVTDETEARAELDLVRHHLAS